MDGDPSDTATKAYYWPGYFMPFLRQSILHTCLRNSKVFVSIKPQTIYLNHFHGHYSKILKKRNGFTIFSSWWTPDFEAYTLSMLHAASTQAVAVNCYNFYTADKHIFDWKISNAIFFFLKSIDNLIWVICLFQNVLANVWFVLMHNFRS